MAAHAAIGGSALLVTFTVRHHRGDLLAGRLDLVSQALRRTLDGSGWKRRRDRLGYVGSIKAVEVTWSEANGWHPHAHVLLLFDDPVTECESNDLQLWLWERWGRIVSGEGFGTINGHGLDVRPVTSAADLGGYLSKVDAGWSVGHEMARSDRKSAAPLQLLARLIETGEARWAALWREYERATYGKRALMFSKGLRARYLGADEGLTDEEAASTEGDGLALLRALFDPVRFNLAVRAGQQGQVLAEVERIAGVLLTMTAATGHVVQPLDVPRPEPAGRPPP